MPSALIRVLGYVREKHPMRFKQKWNLWEGYPVAGDSGLEGVQDIEKVGPQNKSG